MVSTIIIHKELFLLVNNLTLSQLQPLVYCIDIIFLYFIVYIAFPIGSNIVLFLLLKQSSSTKTFYLLFIFNFLRLKNIIKIYLNVVLNSINCKTNFKAGVTRFN